MMRNETVVTQTEGLVPKDLDDIRCSQQKNRNSEGVLLR